MEEAVEVGARFRGAIQPVAALDGIPQRVAVEHEARARHDVGPVAGLVLLQQEEPLMLLGEEPLQRQPNAARATRAGRRRAALEEIEREQPPERRVDAAEIPEVGFARPLLDELRDLAIGCLMLAQCLEAGRGRALEQRVAGKGHPDRADGGIPAEYGRVAAPPGPVSRRGSEDAARCEIPAQEIDRPHMAGVDQPGIIVGPSRLWHGAA